MKLVTFDTLIPDIVAIQPSLAWMLANVPNMICPERRDDVREIIENLCLRSANLNGRIIELETKAIPLDSELTVVFASDNGDLTPSSMPTDPDTSAKIIVITSDTVESLRCAEEGLREALAEVIVARGEAELDELDELAEAEAEEAATKETKFAEAYGGSSKALCAKAYDRIAEDAIGRFHRAYRHVKASVETVRETGCDPFEQVPIS